MGQQAGQCDIVQVKDMDPSDLSHYDFGENVTSYKKRNE